MTERTTNPWSLQCQRCQRFIDWDVPLRLNADNEPCHYDAFTRVLCGPVERVELRSAQPD